jgi:hypothetical protein
MPLVAPSDVDGGGVPGGRVPFGVVRPEPGLVRRFGERWFAGMGILSRIRARSTWR